MSVSKKSNYDFGKNKEVALALDNYIEHNYTQSAVLISGKWGVGKTFFIKEYIRVREEKFNATNEYKDETISPKPDKNKPLFCYISLFDIKTLEEIDNRILAGTVFQDKTKENKIEPTSRLVGQCIKLITGGTIDLDISKIGEDISSLFKKFPEKLVLVIDDIERCTIRHHHILGYFFNILQCYDARIILICDEEKIKDTENELAFAEIKEKVISKTYIVESDPEFVFNATVEKFRDKSSKDFISEYKGYILDLLEKIEHKNLRLFQYYLFLVEEIITCFNKQNEKNKTIIKTSFEKLITALLKFYWLVNLEGMDLEKFLQYKDRRMFASILSTEKKSPRKDIEIETYDRYLPIDLPYGEEEVWIDFFNNIINSTVLVKKYLDYYEEKNKDQEESELLQVVVEMNESQFESQKKYINLKIANSDYNDRREIKNYIIKLFEYIMIGLVNESYKDLADRLIGSIDRSSLNENIKDNNKRIGYENDSVEELDEYKRVMSHLDSKLKARGHLDTINLEKCFNDAISNINRLRTFLKKEMIENKQFILYNIKPDEFIDVVISCPNRRSVLNTCMSYSLEYKDRFSDNKILEWWQEVFKVPETRKDLSIFDRNILIFIFKYIKAKIEN